MVETVFLSWSGGKDSMMCLHRLRSQGKRVDALVTTVTENTGQVSGQGVPESLLRAQARSLGLSLEVVPMPEAPSNAVYKERLGQRLAALAGDRDRVVAFGDLFLADIRRWREAFLAEYGLVAEFPLWGEDTGELMREFLGLGFRAWITCVDTSLLAETFAGRPLDSETLAAMAPEVDPCGENGEYHSFVWSGPGFAQSVGCRPGPLQRDGRTACRPPVATVRL